MKEAVEFDLRRCDGQDTDRWAQVLTPLERLRAERFRQLGDRRRYLIGRGVLRTLLGRCLDRAPHSLDLRTDAFGKPTLADAGDLAFNVSHSGDYVLAAVGRAQAIGVDVERWRPDGELRGVGEQVFTAAERAWIAQAPDAERSFRFFRQWTLKEAVAKAVGLGLSLDVARFEIVFRDGAPHVASQGAPEVGAACDWRLRTIAIAPGYSAALAVRP